MDFNLSLERIPESGLDLDEVVPFDEVRPLLDEQWTGAEAPLRLSLRLEHHGEAVSLVGRLHGRLRGLCSRCAADVTHDLDERFAAVFTAEEATDVKLGDGFSGAEIGAHEWYPIRAGAVDLSEPFRDALALGLPDYVRCPEGRCDPGIERFLVHEGDATKTVDPRLAKLAELRGRLNS